MSQIIIALISDEGELLAQVSDKGAEDYGSDVYLGPSAPFRDDLLRGELPRLLVLMAAAYAANYPLNHVATPVEAGGYRLVSGDAGDRPGGEE